MTRNQELNVLHVKDAKAFAEGVNARVISGDTLIFDFIYFLHPVSSSVPFVPAPCAAALPSCQFAVPLCSLR